ncbi:PREDICTED: F-box protein At4g12382-like [Nelumbo nucifera]|uniref:F-box protein At4g12382-like n=1 Tax=Nelumbo nucifera TaxID=4432 RepID=A0A1U8B678_NELNU|nr:PREDICTED: F-box protein At4g12382-like [Nelumbo nucifera]
MHGHLPQEKKEIRHFMNGDWENLPEGLLDAIAQRLPLTDCLAFHDVCTSWRRVVAKLSGFHARRFPWLVQCREDCTDFIITCFSVLENKLWELELPEAPFKYIVGSFQDWLILKKVTFSSTEFFLLNPFSRAIVVLPKVSDNLFYELVLSTVPTDANCVCMLISPYCNGVILYWVPGTERWIPDCSRLTGGKVIVDFVCCKGNFFLLDSDYDIVVIDTRNIVSIPVKG